MYELTNEDKRNEKWKPVYGFEETYEVSNMGRVRSKLTGKILRPYKRGAGYLGVDLYKNGKRYRIYMHVITAAHWLDTPKDPLATEVNHKFGNKYDNRAESLEYMTRSENVKHSYNIDRILLNNIIKDGFSIKEWFLAYIGDTESNDFSLSTHLNNSPSEIDYLNQWNIGVIDD